MKIHDKNKESSYLQYLDIKNLYGSAMPQKLSVNNFDWIEDTSQFNPNEAGLFELEGIFFWEAEFDPPHFIFQEELI